VKIKVSELFYSLQGEGMFVGVPSVFLRTFGCNFTCSGFGMKRGQASGERDTVAQLHEFHPYKSYQELPLVHTGCDSYASWDPRFKDLSPFMEISEIVDKMQEMLPDGKFGPDKHLIITGGEPLLGWQRAYPDLIKEISSRHMHLTDITFETNGTQLLTSDLQNFLAGISSDIRITFSVSAKLPSSGEDWVKAICPNVVKQYTEIPNSNVYLKFVVSTEEDIKDVNYAVSAYSTATVNVPVYLMPVGGTASSYEKNERNVADYCRDNGFRFSPRIQVPLYKNAWGT
jgi:organic radical activating enzyme